MAEVDRFLRNHSNYVTRIFESHPELAFWRMNDETPLSLPKKVKSRVHPPGLALRRDLLRRAGMPDEALSLEPPKGAGPDDLIDALACLVTARHIFEKTARSFPPSPPRDEHGLPMAIWV